MQSVLAHPRRLETNTLAVLADGKLYGPADDAALGCALGFAFADEETALGTEPVAALVAVEAALVPLATDGGDDDFVEDVLFAA